MKQLLLILVTLGTISAFAQEYSQAVDKLIGVEGDKLSETVESHGKKLLDCDIEELNNTLKAHTEVLNKALSKLGISNDTRYYFSLATAGDRVLINKCLYQVCEQNIEDFKALEKRCQETENIRLNFPGQWLNAISIEEKSFK